MICDRHEKFCAIVLEISVRANMAQPKSEGSHIGLNEKQDVHIHFKEGGQ